MLISNMKTRNSNKRSSVRAVSPASDESPEKVKRVSPIQKGGGEKTRSIKNNRSSLRSVSPGSDELPEKVKRVSPRQIDKENTKAIKNGRVSLSDKGYCGSSSEDESDWQRKGRNAVGSGVVSAKKRKSEGAPDESSDSSSDDFLVPTQSLDLDSDFFKIEKKNPASDFSSIENSIFAGINRLSDSEDSDDSQDTKPVKIERVGSNAGLEEGNDTIKAEHGSSESVTIKVDDVNEIKPPAGGKGKKTAKKQQKSSDKGSRQEKSQQDKALVKSKHFKTENKGHTQKNKKGPIDRNQHRKVKEETSIPDVNKLDVSELLALGEGLDTKGKIVTETKRKKVSKRNVESEEEGISDWEEVDTSTFEGQQVKHTIPKEGIAVTVQVPNIHEKKKKKGFDMAAYVKRRMNRVRRDIQVLMHKAHLLCWIAHGNYVNKILNSEILMGLSLSLIPSKHCYPDKHTDLPYLQQIVQWFAKAVEVEEKVVANEDLLVSLQTQFQKKAAKSRRDMVLMFVCVLRSLGIKTRLVMSLQPLPLKPPLSEISHLTSKKPSATKGKKIKGEPQKSAQGRRKKDAPNASKDVIRKRRDVMTKEEAVRRIKEAAAKKVEQAGRLTQRKDSELPLVSKKSTKSELASDSGRSMRARKSIRKYVDDGVTTDEDEEMVQQEQERDKETKTVDTNSTSSRKQIGVSGGQVPVKDARSGKVSTKPNRKIAQSSGSESDYTAEFKVKKDRKGKTDRRVLSSDSLSDEAPVADTKKKKDRCDVWSEVFLESEEKWICVDVYHRQIHCVRELYSRATQPVQYVLAWQDDGTIRDVTRRYCPQWHTVTRKHRVDEEWWKESLRPFMGHRTARDDEEDEDLDRQLQDRPLPTSLAEYKNHPLYVLKKDLLKFQGIYPPDAPTLGFVRGHPVYARECVHTLHSREIWLKEAKVVRLGESPYKIVKARPKWDRMSGKVIKDLPLELFGSWQVEDYVPPTAVDGKVPRNAYGNVELFKPSMLPGGTVHMQIPGLNRVARKLQIDCAPAVTGFDFHCGSSHPVYDGFVVCEEYKDVLAEAWQAEEEEADRRYEEKRLKRIYGNWRKLIKGLLIRERLKARYDFGPVKEITKSKTKKAKRFQESKRMKTVDSDDSDWEMGQCD